MRNTIHTGPVPIKNVASFMAMTMRLIEFTQHEPGFGVCHGPSGYGKTWASIYAQNKTRAIRVEVGDSWNRRTLLKKILEECGEPVRVKATVAELAEQAIKTLGDHPRRPLIIDEADNLCDKGYIELARELLMKSGAPIILIGEEKLPAKLFAVERVHNRVFDWSAAQPLDLEDARALALARNPELTIKDDLLDAIVASSGGRARRIAVNLMHAAELARNINKSTIDLKSWGSEKFHTGEPPPPRSVEMYAKRTAA